MVVFHPDLLNVFWTACLEVNLVKLLEHASTLCPGTEEKAMPNTGQIRSVEFQNSPVWPT